MAFISSIPLEIYFQIIIFKFLSFHLQIPFLSSSNCCVDFLPLISNFKFLHLNMTLATYRVLEGLNQHIISVTWFVNLFPNRELKKANYGWFWAILGQIWAISKSKLASELCYTDITPTSCRVQPTRIVVSSDVMHQKHHIDKT